MVDASAPDPRHDASRDPNPDPTSDEWSAWLPHLDPPDTSGPETPDTPRTPDAPETPPTATTPPPLPPPPALPHLPPPSPPQASFSITVTPLGGRSHSTGWTYGAGRPAPHLAPGQPPTYLGLALLALVFFAVPFGLVALARSLQVSPHWAAGRFEQARKASRSARRWSVAAIVAIPFAFLLFGTVNGLAMLAGR
ncbi:CD225/dispanin family protein [Intrasporangium sp. YIM S08009]|uniref:CD225/dispanin family protein n=1 Tax=Intrasporangium zincisolvens TaxID=3080018 RepID=UPI002B060511|nr:CD225/dispanin family protein [Intrasporangium sp. YIM S08009]